MLKPKYIGLLLPLLLLLLMPMSVSAHDGHNIFVDTTLTADHPGSIFIKENGVTLDCDGHQVTGPGLEGIGIALEGRTGGGTILVRLRRYRHHHHAY